MAYLSLFMFLKTFFWKTNKNRTHILGPLLTGNENKAHELMELIHIECVKQTIWSDEISSLHFRQHADNLLEPKFLSLKLQ